MYDGASTSPEGEEEYDGFSHDKYLRHWREYVAECAEARRQSFRDQEYYDGDVTGTGLGQWTQAELAKLASRNQPPSVFNVVQRKVDAISGVEQRSRSEPRAHPRTPKDQKAAEIGTDALRFAAQHARWSQIKADAFRDALKSGFAAVEIGHGERSVPIVRIEWSDFFYDPRSRRADFSDARYLGVAKWIDADVAEAIYAPDVPPLQVQMPAPPQIPPPPEDPVLYAQWEPLAMQAQALYAQQVQQAQAAIAEHEKAVAERQRILDCINGTMASGNLAESGDFDDLPVGCLGDNTRRRIFVIDMWHRDPKKGWFRCVFTGAGKLFTEAATMLDDRGRPTHPIMAFSVYVSRKNWRYGVIRNMRPVQDDYNKRRSKALHLLTTNQIVMETGASADGDDEKLRAEANRPDGVMLVRPGARFDLLKNIDLAQGQKAMADDALQFMESLGPNPQLQGEQGQASSGRAIQFLQQAGMGQLGPVFDNLADWELRCYRAMWARMKQYWKGEMYVRVTDDEGAARFVGINGAPPAPDPKQQAIPQQQPMLGHNGGPPMGPQDMGEPGPMLSELDFDIILDRAPEAATLQAEQFEQIAKLASTGVVQFPPEVILEASSLPNKSAIMDKLKSAQEQQSQANPEMDMVKAQLMEVMASIEKMKSEARENDAQTAKLMAETRSVSLAPTLQPVEQAPPAQAPFPPPGPTGVNGPPL